MLYLATSTFGFTLAPGVGTTRGLTAAAPSVSARLSMQIPASPDSGTKGVVMPTTQSATSKLRSLRDENSKLQEALSEQGALDSRTTRVILPLCGLGLGTIATVNAPPDTSVFAEGFQETLRESARQSVVDRQAEKAMAEYFPGALGSLTVDRLVSGVLNSRGYTPKNTLFATSTCPDEVNSMPGELIDLFKNRYGENFQLGGLGGVPFTGKAGFSAYAHHVPTEGNMFIMFAPHVGVEYDGKIGQLQRVNQEEVSTACGAAVGAFKAIMKERQEAKNYELQDGESEYFDAQIDFIKLKLGEKLEAVSSAPNAQAYVAYQMYSIVREFLVNELLTAPGIWDLADEVTVLGGIMINRGKGGDRFMPLMFQSRNPEGIGMSGYGTTLDLYEKAFGKPPMEQIDKLLGGSIPDLFSYELDDYRNTAKREMKVKLTEAKLSAEMRQGNLK